MIMAHIHAVWVELAVVVTAVAHPEKVLMAPVTLAVVAAADLTAPAEAVTALLAVLAL